MCPDYKGVLNSGMNLYYKAQFGTLVSVLNTGESSSQGVLNRGVSMYNYFNTKITNEYWNICELSNEQKYMYNTY